MRRSWDVYAKSGAVSLTVCLVNWMLARRLAPLIRDPALRWACACALLQIVAILGISLYLLGRRAYTRILESLYEQLRPGISERVLALALGGEMWSSGVPKSGPARRVLEESVVHTLSGLTESGRQRVAQFAIAQAFQVQWTKEFSSPSRNRRKQAIARLGLIAKENGVAVVRAALDDQHPAVRIEAARALLLEGDLFSVDKVFRTVISESLLMRALLASDLKRHARDLLAASVPAVLAAGTTLQTTRCLEFMIAWERAIPSFEVEPFLNQRCSPAVWSLVLKMLPYVPLEGLMLEDSVEEHLRTALTSTDIDVRCSAARAAGHLKLQRLVPFLSQTLNQDRQFALASAGAMAQIGASGERNLARVVSGSDRRAAAVAMEALEHLAVGLR